MSVQVDVQEEPPDRAGSPWLALLVWLVLALVLGGAFWILLNACGLRVLQGSPLLSFCPAPPAAPAADPTLGAEIARQRALEAEIERLELALLRAPACAPPEPPPTEADVVPERQPAPAPAPPPEPDAIPEDAWREQDVGFLEGCWRLDTDYRLREVESGEVRQAQDWQVCFDAEGEGRQTLTFDDGTECTGPMLGDFEGGRLQLKDRGNLPCEGGMFIYERHLTCERVDAAHARCDSFQPETDSRGEVTLRHEPGEGD